MSYNLARRRHAATSRRRRSPRSSSSQITNWNDPAIAADNPDATLPDDADRRRPPRRRLGHDARTSPSSSTTPSAPTATARGRSATAPSWSGPTAPRPATATAAWPRSSPRPTGRSATSTSATPRPAASTFAIVKNKAGKFVEPTLEATTAAAENATINDDLTFFTRLGRRRRRLPDRRPDLDHRLHHAGRRRQGRRRCSGFLTYLLTRRPGAGPGARLRSAARGDLRDDGAGQHRQDRRLTHPTLLPR